MTPRSFPGVSKNSASLVRLWFLLQTGVPIIIIITYRLRSPLLKLEVASEAPGQAVAGKDSSITFCAY